jgi:hypothetical protein
MPVMYQCVLPEFSDAMACASSSWCWVRLEMSIHCLEEGALGSEEDRTVHMRGRASYPVTQAAVFHFYQPFLL